ncbi:MAG: CHAT domain-containing protein, partial [Cyanobacteria bacterium J06650_10]
SFTATTADQIAFEDSTLNVLEQSQDYTGLTGAPTALTFSGESAGAVVNHGELAVTAGESLSLVGGSVVNTGRLEAPAGEIGLVAVGGNSTLKLAMPGSLLSMEVEIKVEAEAATLDPKLSHQSTFVATDLPELLTGAAIESEAQSLIVNADGSVVLGGRAVDAGTAAVAGEISVAAPNGMGGTAVVLGESVAVVDATIEASGDRGGTIRIGGDLRGEGTLPTANETFIDSASVVRADGETTAGGHIVAWADDNITVQATISAQGITEGGFVETSADYIDISEAQVTAGGKSAAGTWLVDPVDIEIVGGLAAGINQISDSTIESTINANTNFEVTTSGAGVDDGDLTLSTDIIPNASGTGSLTLTSRRFENSGGHRINLAGGGDLTFNLNAVNPETNPDGSSIENAIGSIGFVPGRRLIRLGAGDYGLIETIDVTTNVDIEGLGATSTSLTTLLAGTKAIRVEPAVSAAIRNVTVTTAGLGASDLGGGITNQGTLVVENSHFIDNRALQNGGAIDSFRGGSLTVLNSLFSGNRTGLNGSGGAIHIGEATGLNRISNSIFENNRATNNGGALNVSGATIRIENGTQFIGNRAEGTASSGGAIAAMRGAVATLTDVEFRDNVSTERGAGLFLNGDSVATVTGTLTTDANGNISSATTRFTNNTAGKDGGGIAARDNSQLTASGVLFEGNFSGDDGGGVAVTETSHAVIDNTNFENNTTAQNGGGLYSNNVTATIPVRDKITLTNSRFIGNTANISGGGFHQGINGATTVENSLFRDNEAVTDGGGIHVSGGGLTLTNSQLIANRARFGAGLEVSSGGDAVVRDTSISGNISSLFGGGAQADQGTKLQLQNTTFEGNTAVDGGGLFNQGTAEIVNSTFSGNLANDEGGAIHSYSTNARLTVQNSTVTANEARTSGGGIVETNSQLARLQNTIVAANVGPASADVRGRFTDSGNNLVGIQEGATGFLNSQLVGSRDNPIDPRLAPLSDNGGSTRTHLPLSDSLAIDMGSNLDLPDTDQRGLARQLGQAVDIGAVELSATDMATISVSEAIESPIESLLESPIESLDPTLTSTSFSELDTLLARRTEHNLESADIAIQRLEQSMSQGFEDYWDLSAGPELTFSEVQAILRRAQEEYTVNSAVVYAIFAPESPDTENSDTILQVDPTPDNEDLLNISVVLPEGELVSYELPVTRQEVSRQVRYFRSAVSDPEDERGYRPLAQQLYQWLLAPLEQELAAQNIQNLMYALDDGLRTAPISAMRDYEGFSLERYGISVVPSMSLMQANFPTPVRRSTVAMGVSEFTRDEPLPAVPIELAVVDQFVPVSQTTLNEETTLAALKNVKTLEQPGVLHLATHASFNRRSPEESFIHLWNEPLSMKEFSTLGWEKSDLELLILSACSTAMSSRNAELGFAGLAAASGVDATVGSLWEVSDVGTLALMSEFYAQLENNPLRIEALRQAQLALLKGETRIEGGNLVGSHGVVELPDEWNLPDAATLDHPFFWSAFTMVGNPW